MKKTKDSDGSMMKALRLRVDAVSKLQLAGIFFVYLSMLGLAGVSNASHGGTPTVETVCDGLEGKMFGICYAYCETMDCDNPDHMASDKACYKKAQSWTEIAEGKVIPCNEAPKVSLSKEVNAEGPLFEIPVGEPVVYTFKILNDGTNSNEDRLGAVGDINYAIKKEENYIKLTVIIKKIV